VLSECKSDVVIAVCQLASTSSEDSSSCSGESGRLRPGNSGRLRLGVRMGTRRHQLDYTSSSDQSCDTVIYVGSDGCPISDHELTDYERPPPTTTTVALGGCSDSSMTTGQDGAGSGNLARFRGKSATFRSNLPRAVGGQHSDGELMTSSRRLRGSFSRKPAWRSPPPPPPLQMSAKKSAEMWIDGPKSIMSRVEQWVDGPPEFRHADDDKCNVKITSDPAELRPPATADGGSNLSEIVEETELHSSDEASAALTDRDIHVIARSDKKEHGDKVIQSPLRAEQSDISDSNCTTKVSDLQFTVVVVHQSADGDNEVTEISSTSPDFVVRENHRMSTDSVDLPSVERREASGRTKLDIDALLLANRESIYELQMDEELETGSRESLLQLVCGSDDDWSTCGTEPRKSKCCESGSFRDVDACLQELDDMEVTSGELTELKTSSDAEKSDGRQQENEEESTKINVASEVAQQHVWIRSQDIDGSATNCVESDNPDRNFADVATTVSSKTESCAVTNPARNNRTRQSALPMPVSSSQSRVRRKPPPIPVRSSSMSQSGDRSTDGQTTSTNIAVTSTPPKTRSDIVRQETSDVVHQETSSGSKNGSASPGFCSRDCLAAREAEVTTGIATVATTSPSRGNGVVTETAAVVDAAKPPASVPPPATKSRSRIALPCRRDKKSKQQAEVSASSGSPSRTTASPSVSPATASREMRAAAALVSPYHSVTKPRTSKGGDSDNSSSVLSSERAVSTSRIQMTTGARRRGGSARGTRSEVEASSGYESMIRDSEEVTGASSASECQSPFRLKANKLFRKKGLATGCRVVYLLVCIAQSSHGMAMA